ncbi:MAG: hypothetical protein IOD12_00710 [Silvanigrellales bacterium]|nr:hypothetical protein [Silvanigrellales bacterium]
MGRFDDGTRSAFPGVEVFAPGRVNLIGEHTDYNGGLVLPFAIDLGLELRLSFEPRSANDAQGPTDASHVLLCHSTYDGATRGLNAKEMTELVQCVRDNPLSSDLVPLPSAAQGNTLGYLAGALSLLFAQGDLPRDTASNLKEDRRASLLNGRARLRVDIDSTLPAGAGLSSSAALCTGFLQGAQALFGGTLSGRELARTAMHVEHRFAGAHVGLMDQLAVTYGRTGTFLAINFLAFPERGTFECEPVAAQEAFDAYVPLIFHTGVTHSLAGSEYNTRRLQCGEALSKLRDVVRWPESKSPPDSLSHYSMPEGFRALFGREIQDALSGAFTQALAETHLRTCFGGDDVLARRAGHVVFENIRVRAAMDALRMGRLAALSRLMQDSHESLRFSYEVSCRELDAAAALVPQEAERLAKAPHRKTGPLNTLALLGARMTGGGFGGSTIQLVHESLVTELLEVFAKEDNPYTRTTGAKPRLVVSRPSEGLRLHYI